jgi:hypothetical protein
MPSSSPAAAMIEDSLRICSHLLAIRVTASSTRARLQPSSKSALPSKYSIHLHIHMSKKKTSLEKTPPPAPHPPRSPARKSPYQKVSTWYPPPPPTRDNRSPLPHISHDPRILVRLFAHRNSLSLFLLLDSACQGLSPTLARNTVHRHAHYRFFFFFTLPEISPLQTSRPVSPHHITSRTVS